MTKREKENEQLENIASGNQLGGVISAEEKVEVLKGVNDISDKIVNKPELNKEEQFEYELYTQKLGKRILIDANTNLENNYHYDLTKTDVDDIVISNLKFSTLREASYSLNTKKNMDDGIVHETRVNLVVKRISAVENDAQVQGFLMDAGFVDVGYKLTPKLTDPLSEQIRHSYTRGIKCPIESIKQTFISTSGSPANKVMHKLEELILEFTSDYIKVLYAIELHDNGYDSGDVDYVADSNANNSMFMGLYYHNQALAIGNLITYLETGLIESNNKSIEMSAIASKNLITHYHEMKGMGDASV